jgi:hypothetical protein
MTLFEHIQEHLVSDDAVDPIVMGTMPVQFSEYFTGFLRKQSKNQSWQNGSVLLESVRFRKISTECHEMEFVVNYPEKFSLRVSALIKTTNVWVDLDHVVYDLE